MYKATDYDEVQVVTPGSVAPAPATPPPPPTATAPGGRNRPHPEGSFGPPGPSSPG